MNRIKKAIDVLSGDCPNPVIKADMVKVLRERYAGLENTLDAQSNHVDELKVQNETLRTERDALTQALDGILELEKHRTLVAKNMAHALSAAHQVVSTLEA